MLQITKINKKYHNNEALKNVSFSIKTGKICGLLGLNGAGKSTLMKIVTSLTSKDTGEVVFKKSPLDNSTSIGYMIETPSFYTDLSGYNNLLLLSSLYNNVSKSRVSEVLCEVGLNEVKKKLVDEYSLGMKQRLYFAYAILNKPEILILDEPFNGIDPVTSRLFKTLIKKLSKEGCTVLVSSHVISDVKEICDKVIILEKGHVVYDNDIQLNENLEELFLSYVSSDGIAQ